jgi:hypothetical protein
MLHGFIPSLKLKTYILPLLCYALLMQNARRLICVKESET